MDAVALVPIGQINCLQPAALFHLRASTATIIKSPSRQKAKDLDGVSRHDGEELTKTERGGIQQGAARVGLHSIVVSICSVFIMQVTCLWM